MLYLKLPFLKEKRLFYSFDFNHNLKFIMERVNPHSDIGLGFVGAGNMTSALVKGFISYANIPPNLIYVSAPSARGLGQFESQGCNTFYSTEKMIYSLKQAHRCPIIFLCIKTNVFFELAYYLLKLFQMNNYTGIVVSVMPGVTLQQLDELIGEKKKAFRIIRIIPNIACQFGKGTFPLSYDCVADEEISQCKLLLSKIGSVFDIKESYLDLTTAVNGSGIAFILTFMQIMVDGGVKMGLPRDLSSDLVREAARGAVELVHQTRSYPHELLDKICTPGGTTATGLAILNTDSFNSTVVNAIEAATNKSKELGSKSSK